MPTQYALSEFESNVRQKDIIKARLVLANFNEYSPEVRKKLLFRLSQTEDILCLRILSSLFKNREDLFQTYPDLENIFSLKARDNPGFLLDQLKPNTANLRGYAWIAGRTGMQEAANSLESLLYKVKDAHTLAYIVQALGEMGTVNNPGVLAELIFLQDQNISLAAIGSLGKIGTPACLDILVRALGRDQQLDIIILDTLGELETDTALERLNSLLRSSNPRIRNQAGDKLTYIGSRAVPWLVDNLHTGDIDVQIQSLNILSRIGDPVAVRSIMKLISRYPDDPNLRFAAYEALGSLPVEKSAYMLARGMMDPEESVRLSVARAIDHNCNQQLVSGISNMLSDEEMALAIVQAILDSQSEQIFLQLLDNSTFWNLALQYLIYRAHPDLHSFYARLLQDQGKQDMARVLLSSRDNTAFDHSKRRICAVDDSRMVLQAYRSKLYELGFEPVLFNSPQEALAWLENQKPALLITDLNMPQIDGIELIKGVRKNYSKSELPVVLVTSQKDVGNSDKAYQAGANNTLIKPFNSEDLQGVIDNLLENGS